MGDTCDGQDLTEDLERKKRVYPKIKGEMYKT